MKRGLPLRDDLEFMVTGSPDDLLDRHRHSGRPFSTWPEKYDRPLPKDRKDMIASPETPPARRRFHARSKTYRPLRL